MSYKPDEKDWIAYLYGELDGESKEKFEQYLLENAEARKELQKFHGLRNMLGSVEDKEVIAPPIFIDSNQGSNQRYFWQSSYFKTIMSIAASLVIVILIGKVTGTQMSITDNEFKLTFGGTQPSAPRDEDEIGSANLTAADVQDMINKSVNENNTWIQTSLKENESKLTESVRKNLAMNSSKIDNLVRQASTASQDQIQQYVSTLQSENMQVVKDYFQLTSTQQKEYIENLLVDFADYLQQQRKNDIQLVETRLNSLEQNTDIFKQETEEILTSIISTVGTNSNVKETRN